MTQTTQSQTTSLEKNARWLTHGVTLVLLTGLLACPTVVGAQSPAITPEVSISQDAIKPTAGIPLRTIVESGRHFFSTPFTAEDGYGEGGALDMFSNRMAGPREQAFNANVVNLAQEIGIDPRREPGKLAALLTKFNHPLNTAHDPQGKRFPFLRLNGLDSQSCFECHNSIGSDHMTDTAPGSSTLGRKASVTGGPAGFASNAFINPNLPNPLIMFVRNPPHVFGAEYTQRLAEEMTEDLQWLKLTAALEAVKNPGKWTPMDLETHGVEFGQLQIRYIGPEINVSLPEMPAATEAEAETRSSMMKAASKIPAEVKASIETLFNEAAPVTETATPPSSIAAETFGTKLFEINTSGLEGISDDLVVRPFQWKGIASNERNFVKDALNFHFGMLAVEIEEEEDEDRDGVTDEVSVGNVTALTTFTLALRPPVQSHAWDPVNGEFDTAKKASAERGQELFMGVDAGIPETHACAFCHRKLTIRDQQVTVRDPRPRKEQLVGLKAGLSSQRRSSADLPVVQSFMRKLQRSLDPDALQPESDTSPHDLTFPLDLTGQGDMPTFTQKRLSVNDDGTTEVPLFSDLKRHDMGEGLTDQFDQETDVKGIFAPKREFLTRALWGVADTGPWLHDGRALSLRQAILLHESPGSEANNAIETFRGLSDSDQQAVIDFLLTLRLPTDPRYRPDDPRPDTRAPTPPNS